MFQKYFLVPEFIPPSLLHIQISVSRHLSKGFFFLWYEGRQQSHIQLSVADNIGRHRPPLPQKNSQVCGPSGLNMLQYTHTK